MDHCANKSPKCKCAIGSKIFYGVSKLIPNPEFVYSMPITSAAETICGTDTLGKNNSWYKNNVCYSCYCDSVRVATRSFCSGKTGDIGDNFF